MMKSICFLMAIVAIVQGTIVVPHNSVSSEETYTDSCTGNTETSECANNPGVFGVCKEKCTEITEHAALAPDLCPENCVCCSKTVNLCERTYVTGFCSAGGCEDGLLEVMTGLCSSGFVCCRTPPKLTGTNQMTEAGERGVGVHFHTFDGLKFKFGGNCGYTLVKEKSSNPSFHVTTKHSPASDGGNQLGAFQSSVEVKRNEHIVALNEGNQKVTFNGQEIRDQLPFESDDHTVIVDWNENQKHVVVSLPGILSIEFNGKGQTMIDLHSSQHGKVWGLLGNSNGNKDDDLMYEMADGKTNKIEVKDLHETDVLRNFFNGWLTDCST